uniref:BHLH domain-containing protein n=1 Tax=Entomoneis paludosa TaxID=265537 RepID=A0A7S2Y2G6_9STRA|mmetsp:Transcript_13509/g.27966  ORF Transcript_13509/g.27966 Transcript_13509/m.27966 type:complete len:404 (+) Transcript_13509:529-1740(+)|eukprot:CAMPEP_0172460924 /NCGR_PEP_ID=MMETSP1065-20121228/38850_1 /TAXON_ID=265537 /ORGANISM="Amphiprora paludosa, Strain CCMP125" /LENGTH=403 /DNA_ID=CAMNT_0013216095 /DNA_START=521 /DNA_END=1732 /DNA_ORIENTATION=+
MSTPNDSHTAPDLHTAAVPDLHHHPEEASVSHEDHEEVVAHAVAAAAHLSEDMMHEFLQGVSFDPHHHFQHEHHHPEAPVAVECVEVPAPTESTAEGTTTATTTAESKPPPTARSDRKRAREKQRRADVNQKFDELTSMLKSIEVQLTETASSSTGASPLPPFSYGAAAGSGSASSCMPNNRVDLIARTIQILSCLSQERQSLLEANQDLDREFKRAKKAGEETAAKLKQAMTQPVSAGKNQMLMMVPMLVQQQQAQAQMQQAQQAQMQQAQMPAAAAAASSEEATPSAAMPAMASPFMHPGMMGMPGMMPMAPTDASAAAGMPTMTPWGPMMMPSPMGMPWAGNPMMASMPSMTTTAMPTPAAASPPSGGSSPQGSDSLDNSSQGKPAAAASSASGNLAHCA